MRLSLFVGALVCSTLSFVHADDKAQPVPPAATPVATPPAAAPANVKVAEDSGKQTLAALKLKLDHAARRANQPATGASSVIAVRGSPKSEDERRKLYWAGKKARSQAATPDEVRDLRKIVEQVEAQHAPEALTQVQAFEKKYPKSQFSADVQALKTQLTKPN